MTLDRWIVVLIGVAGIVFIAWFFWFKRVKGIAATVTADGYQEAMILVQNGYTPNAIVVQRGKPVRLNFRREESDSCSDTVVFPDFNKSAKLPEGQVIPLEFLPGTAGRYEFRCPMGMHRGTLFVE